MFSHIENTFNLKLFSYFEHTYNGATRPETPIYFHRILHSSVAVSNMICILNDTSSVTDKVFAIFQKRLEKLNLTFHHLFRI